MKNIPDNLKGLTNEILTLEKEITGHFKALSTRKISAMKIRIHGDYHLEQVFFTGNDFAIIDFEGKLARNLSERRLKRSPLRDVAGMIRSFRYATHTALLKYAQTKPEDIPVLEPLIDLWYRYVAGIFLRSYLETAGSAPFIPKNREELDIMLRAYLLEKAVHEIGHEINTRPEWITIPFKGIKHLLETK